MRRIRLIAAAAVLAASSGTLVASAADTIDQTQSCSDGAKRVWKAKAVWGAPYVEADGTTKITIDQLGWTTEAGTLATQAVLKTYRPDGSLLQTLTNDQAINYNGGAAWFYRNPQNPPSKPGQSKVTLTVGQRGTAGCTVTFVQPGAPTNLAPSVLTASPVSSTSMKVDWTAVAGATGYLVSRDGGGVAGATGWSTTDPATATSRTFNKLVPGATYRFSVQAMSGSTQTAIASTVATAPVAVDPTPTATPTTPAPTTSAPTPTAPPATATPTVPAPSTASPTTAPPAPTTPAPTTTAPTTAPPAPTTPPASTEAAVVNGWGTPFASDEFNYVGPPTSTKWSVYNSSGHAGKGLRRAQQVGVNGSHLRLTGDSVGTTGGMSFKPDRGSKYGRWEARMRVPQRDTEYHPVLIVWPDAGRLPANHCQEIDFSESTTDPNVNKFFLHTGCASEQTTVSKTMDMTQWHNFAVEWTASRVTGYIDGVKWFEDVTPSNIPQDPAHLTLQLDWFPDGTATSTSYMDVDWVRVYRP